MTETYISSCNPLSTRLSQYVLQAEKTELLPFRGSWGKCYVRVPFEATSEIFPFTFTCWVFSVIFGCNYRSILARMGSTLALPNQISLLFPFIAMYCSLIHVRRARGWHQLQGEPVRRRTGCAELARIPADKGLLGGTGQERWAAPCAACPARGCVVFSASCFPAVLFLLYPTDCYVQTACPHYTCLSVTKCCLSVLSVSETVDQAIIFLKETYSNAGIQIGVIQLEAWCFSVAQKTTLELSAAFSCAALPLTFAHPAYRGS